MTLNNKYQLGEIVYLITDTDQSKRMITGIQVSFEHLLYRLACGITDSWHFESEITRDKKYNL